MIARPGRMERKTPRLAATAFAARILIATGLITPCAAPAQGPAGGPRGQSLLVDPSALSDRSRAAFVTGVVAAFPDTAQWFQVKMPANSNLSLLVNATYRFNGHQQLTVDALIHAIVDANGLRGANSVPAGRLLRVPRLPVRPAASEAVSGRRQVTFPNGGKLISLMSRTGGEKALTVQADAAIQATAPIWDFRDLTADQTRRIMAGLPFDDPTTRQAIAADPGTQMVSVYIPEYDLPAARERPSRSPSWSAVSASVPFAPYAAPIGPAPNVPPLSVLDFFTQSNATASHGERVVSVIRQVLQAAGDSALASHIECVEMDYFANRSQAVAEIEKYIQPFSPDLKGSFSQTLDSLRTIARPTQDHVPALFLQAVLGNRLSAASPPAVITISLEIPGQFVFTVPAYMQPESRTILVAASDGSTLIRSPDAISEEPQRSVETLRNDDPVALVSALLDSATQFGMLDSNTTAMPLVTTVDAGKGWGTPGSTPIVPTDSGTSFAAPAIAAKLWLAMLHTTASALSVRDRMLASAEPNVHWINDYASAGIPRLDIMLAASGAYGIDQAHRLFVLSSTSRLIVDQFDTTGAQVRR